ncbi:uncharacterized protein LOC144912291 [Branchiostoma floridae x Branchiostoma belcheri]
MILTSTLSLIMLFLSGFPEKGEGTAVDLYPQIEAVRSDLNTTVGETVEMEFLYGVPVNSSERDVVKTIYKLKHGHTPPRENVCEILSKGSNCSGQYQTRARLEEKAWDSDDQSSFRRGLLVLTLEKVMLSDEAVYEGEVRVERRGYNQSRVSITVADVPWCPYRSCPDGEWLECQTDTDMVCSCSCRPECTTCAPSIVGAYFGGFGTAVLLLFLLYKCRNRIKNCCNQR